MKITITTLAGLESVLYKELSNLNVSNIQVGQRAVTCEGSWSHVYRCNYLLRTAIRVLLPIKECTIENEDALYEAAHTVDWSAYIKPKSKMAIKSVVNGEQFTNSRYVLYKVKDAIVDQLSERHNFRPRIDPKQADVLINVHIKGDALTISLDTSGRSLHLRNYKERAYKAPVSEVLASGILLLSEWEKEKDLVDPMAGSGTFITEGLMQAANMPAGYYIEEFGFEKWDEFYPDIFKSVKETANDQIRSPECTLYASDLNSYAVRDVRKNMQRFPFKEKVKIFQRDFFKMPPRKDTHMIMNPPYDSRLKVADINDFYKQIGDSLKNFWAGSTAWVLTNRMDAMKHFGLHSSAKYTLDNGGKPAKLYKFEMYEGSRKKKHQNYS